MYNRIASHRIASHRIASHRIASHRIASHRIASHRTSTARLISLALITLFGLSACGGDSSTSDKTTTLSAPARVVLTLKNQNQIGVTWDAVANAEGYKVYLAEQPITTLNIPSFANHGSLTGSQTQAVNSGTTHTFTDLVHDKTYYVLVQSIGNGNSTLDSTYAKGQEQSKLIPIAAPTDVQFKKNGTDYALTWGKPAGISDFIVYTAKSDLSGKTVAQLDALLNDTDANKKTTKTPLNTNQYAITGLNATDKVYAVVVSVLGTKTSTPALADTGFVKKGQRFYKMQGQAGKCVVDLDKNLTWEAKQASGLHGKDHVYSWYQTSNNKGDAGTQNGGKCHNKSTTTSGNQCDTTGFVNSVNAETWCGFNDWRMPTNEELKSLIDKDRKAAKQRPMIDTMFFPNTPAQFSWSSLAHRADRAHGVDFYYGFDYTSPKFSCFHARLARAR